jgi:hypothetical protein
VHPLHGIEGGKLLDYDNNPPTCVDLNDPELEAFDPHAHYSLSPMSPEDDEVVPAETSSSLAEPSSTPAEPSSAPAGP